MNLEKITKQDVVASFVVFIIALPLSLGIALASGASLASGLITGVIGGIVAGFFSGAPLGVSGAAAGLSAFVFQIIQQYGVQGLAIATVVCGILQIVMGSLKAGKLFELIPKSILEGVLTAIGLIIVLGQLHILVGEPMPSSPGRAVATLHEVYFDNFLSPVIFCGVVAIVIQLFWKKLFPKLQSIPSALPAVVIATLLSQFWEMPRVMLEPIAPAMYSAVGFFFGLEWLQQFGSLLTVGVGLAVVASAETLITARAVDVMTNARVPAKLNKELCAQGLANTLSGVIGGLPMTAVMVRSSANISSGAQTRWSTVLHGVWTAIFIGLFSAILIKIPLTALASILVLTGIKLMNIPHLILTLKKSYFDGGFWIFTSAAVIATDLLVGLVVSLSCYALLNIRNIYARVFN